MREINNKWHILIIAALAVFWAGSVVRYNKLVYEIRSMKLCSVILQAVDAETGESLPTSVMDPRSNLDERFPVELNSTVVPPSAIKLQWIGIRGVTFVVTSEGYEKKPVTIENESPWRITVGLSKLDKQVK